MIDDHHLEIISQNYFQKGTVFERVEVREIVIRPEGVEELRYKLERNKRSQFLLWDCDSRNVMKDKKR